MRRVTSGPTFAGYPSSHDFLAYQLARRGQGSQQRFHLPSMPWIRQAGIFSTNGLKYLRIRARLLLVVK